MECVMTLFKAERLNTIVLRRSVIRSVSGGDRFGRSPPGKVLSSIRLRVVVFDLGSSIHSEMVDLVDGY